MWISDKWQDFELIDCSGGEKLERWGDRILIRPDPQAIWKTPRRSALWDRADARYHRSSSGGGQWGEGMNVYNCPSCGAELATFDKKLLKLLRERSE